MYNVFLLLILFCFVGDQVEVYFKDEADWFKGVIDEKRKEKGVKEVAVFFECDETFEWVPEFGKGIKMCDPDNDNMGGIEDDSDDDEWTRALNGALQEELDTESVKKKARLK